MKTIINHIVNEYIKFNTPFECDNSYDLDDYDRRYQIWLDNITKELENAHITISNLMPKKSIVAVKKEVKIEKQPELIEGVEDTMRLMG